jgi:protein SHQ1
VLAEIKIAKALIGWNLEELETAALESLERESDSDDLSSEDSDDFYHAPL